LFWMTCWPAVLTVIMWCCQDVMLLGL